MAQWGAYGYAQRGWTYDKILAHYYTGTTLGPAPVARVRVMLAEGRRQLTVASEAPFTVRDGIGQVWHLAAGEQTFGPGLLLKTTDVQQPQQLPAPLAFLPGSSPLRLGGRPYRGQLLVSVANGSLRAVNSVGLEGYLFGVVPSEMPNTWLPEALKAQAVAARSYALAVRKTGSWFDLYSDTRSQVYLGIAHEKPSTTAAVQATAGRGRPLRRPCRDDVLLLELGWAHSSGQRGLEWPARSVPRLGRRPLRHDLSSSPLGAARHLCRPSRQSARATWATDGRAYRAVALGLRPDGDGRRRPG